MSVKTVIIGGVAGGATTAARLRRKDESMQIIMFERGDYISYANCGLPYYVGDVIQSRDALLLQTPEAMMKKFNMEVRISSEVMRIIPEVKKVVVKNLKTGESYEESYDNLVIATGSSPIRPNIPGMEADNIFTLWTVPDTDRIKTYIEEKKPSKAVVIGGGFIGLEMADNFYEAGMEVTLIEMQDQVMPNLDYDLANLLHENMRRNNVNLILGDGVKAFHNSNAGLQCGCTSTVIELTSGTKIEADMIILSIGVRPNSGLAKEAGLVINQRGGIVVDDYLRTSVENIYAVGDVIEVEHYVTKQKTMIPLAGPANKQARILADNLTGEPKKYKGTLGTAVAKVFDMTAASVGLNEKQLQALGKVKHQDYFTVLINQKSHAGYYPGATTITLKMVFDKEGKIFGGQIVGQDGVDKRIDTIATTMKLNGTVYDLSELELAYAPPFSSAKDPVNMLGFVAENLLQKHVSFLEWSELDEMMANKKDVESFTVLDVTEDMERMVYSIPDSYHIPLGQLRERKEELPKDHRIIIYCAVGIRAYNAARILIQNGYEKVAVLSGGTSFYKSMHHYDKIDNSLNQTTSEPQRTEKEMTAAQQIPHDKEIKIVDCCGLQCPGPIMKVHEAVCSMKESEILQVSSTDMGFAADVDSWCRRTGNRLLKVERQEKQNIVFIQKGPAVCPPFDTTATLPQGKTMVVFSGDLDKLLASFIIANGAAAMGRPVTMFFTFWGLNALRKPKGKGVKKPFIDKMFGLMMPKGSTHLKLSKLNMGGMGTALMKKVMHDKNVNSLEELMQSAMKNGVKLVACTMSMDIMGITREEIIDGVEYAGVAAYLGDAEESNVNLFI